MGNDAVAMAVIEVGSADGAGGDAAGGGHVRQHMGQIVVLTKQMLRGGDLNLSLPRKR